jgi:hypothetical protein
MPLGATHSRRGARLNLSRFQIVAVPAGITPALRAAFYGGHLLIAWARFFVAIKTPA